MTTDRSIEEIREAKREQLQDEATDDSTQTPTDPIPIESKRDLTELVAEYDVVLADFYADWCGPCQMLEPVVGGIAAEEPAAVAKIDVDVNQQLANEYGVRGVPTLVLFADGEPVEELVGVQQYDQLAALIDQYSS